MSAIRVGAATDKGLVRSNNQDRLLVAPPLFAVADGMGGHAAGEVASDTAVKSLEISFSTAAVRSAEALVQATEAANKAVWDQARSDPGLKGMGTTLVAAALVDAAGSEELAVVNVGDSRLYRLRDAHLEQLTTDHSVVAEMVADGQLPEEEAEFHPQRHVLTRALGVEPRVVVDLDIVLPCHGDRYLLCSDGLPREVSEAGIASILRRYDDPTETARELLSEAKLRGGNDNITAVVFDLLASAASLPGQRADRVEKAQPGLVVPPFQGLPGPSGDGSHEVPRALNAMQRPRARIVTFRVVGFFVLLLAALGVAAGGTAWYARASYFVGLDGDHLTIFQGRPGGLLWFEPTVAERSAVTTSQVESRHLAALRAGVEEATLSAARRYIANLEAEWSAAQAANLPHLPVTTTTSGTATSNTTASTSAAAERGAGAMTPARVA